MMLAMSALSEEAGLTSSVSVESSNLRFLLSDWHGGDCGALGGRQVGGGGSIALSCVGAVLKNK
jgi:hypothetical protein